MVRLDRSTGASLALAAALAFPGCTALRESSEPWVYILSRNFYPSLCDNGEFMAAMFQDTTSSCAALTVLCVLAVPFAVDTVLLPVTVPHDLWVAQ